MKRDIPASASNRTPLIQPVASRYRDSALSFYLKNMEVRTCFWRLNSMLRSGVYLLLFVWAQHRQRSLAIINYHQLDEVSSELTAFMDPRLKSRRSLFTAHDISAKNQFRFECRAMSGKTLSSWGVRSVPVQNLKSNCQYSRSFREVLISG